MKKLCILSLLFYFIVPMVHSQKLTCEKQPLSFIANEKLQYLVQYNWGMIWVDAGEATFSVNSSTINNKECLQFLGIGSTFKKYDWFYKVQDRFESFVDTSDFVPVRYIRNTSEGSLKTYNDNYFFSSKGTVVSYHLVKGKVRKDSVNVSGCVLDVLSAIYYTRTLDFSYLSAGSKVYIKLFLDGKIFKQAITYIGKEVVTINSSTYKCFKIKPSLIEGTIFKKGDEMTVWVSDDLNRIPLYIETPIVVGSIKVSIKEMKGLKFDLSSKIK